MSEYVLISRLALINQAKFTQLPIMILISGGGYVVSYFSNLQFSQASEIASAIGALVIGILGNMYSRVGHGLAFAAMLPAIFVQVPSGLAAQGSLISGLQTANEIVSNSSAVVTTTIAGSVVTTTVAATSVQTTTSNEFSTSGIWGVGVSMIQVSVGIVVGLFVATLVVYPFGKKRSGLFTF